MTHVIGITGAFGSGCTSAAKFLRDHRSYQMVALSHVIRQRWEADNSTRASRLDLQRLGDSIRETGGPSALTKMAVESLPRPLPTHIVIDGIRNVAEVDFLQEEFGHYFTLFAILTPTQARWDRIGATAYTDFGLSQKDFLADDTRDRNEETLTGQQVELCVDRADVFLDNGPPTDPGTFKEKVLAFADLVTGQAPRHPEQREILMNMAYAASHSSKCVKRHVGAVVVDAAGQVVGVGYNENPLRTKPCVEEIEYDYKCYRDKVRNEHFATLSQNHARCPVCGCEIPLIEGPPWRCKSCEESGKKTNLESFFFPDRALSWCTAVHAEVWAVLASGERARGSALYTSTFPCFQCAEKIIQAGIEKVVYTEVYPDVKSEHRFKLAEIELERFEGVRSSKFERIFSSVKPR